METDNQRHYCLMVPREEAHHIAFTSHSEWEKHMFEVHQVGEGGEESECPPKCGGKLDLSHIGF